MPSATVTTTTAAVYPTMPNNRLKRDSTNVVIGESNSAPSDVDSVKKPRLADTDSFGHNMFKTYVKTTLDEAEKVWLSLFFSLLFYLGPFWSPL